MSESAKITINAARVIQGTGNDPIKAGAVIVEEGKISGVGTQLDLSMRAKGTEMIDAGDRTLLPGLMDMHTHLCLWTSAWDPKVRLSELYVTDEAIAATAINAVRNAKNFIKHGITTVRDLGCIHHGVFAVKKAIDNGQIAGPRVFAAGSGIRMTGGHCSVLAIEADGVDGVRRAAREQLKAGADVIKLFATGAASVAWHTPYEVQLTVEEMAAACEEAHNRGKTTSAHAVNAKGAMNAILAGIDSIEHGLLLNEEVLQEMAARGVFYVPTIGVFQEAARTGGDCTIEDWVVQRLRPIVQQHVRNVQRAMEIGVRIAAGADNAFPINSPERLVEELQWYVKLGMDTMTALRTATEFGAECLGLDEKLGTIEVGKVADLVVIDGDPLQDIQTLNNVWLVMKGGNILVRDGVEPAA